MYVAAAYCGCVGVPSSARKICDSYCANPCPGDTRQACGSDNYASIYNVSSKPLSKRAHGSKKLELKKSAKLHQRPKKRERGALSEWLRGDRNAFEIDDLAFW